MDNKCMTGREFNASHGDDKFYRFSHNKSWLTTFNKDVMLETLTDKDMIPHIEGFIHNVPHTKITKLGDITNEMFDSSGELYTFFAEVIVPNDAKVVKKGNSFLTTLPLYSQIEQVGLNPVMALKAVMVDGIALKYIICQTDEICDAACKQNPLAKQFKRTSEPVKQTRLPQFGFGSAPFIPPSSHPFGAPVPNFKFATLADPPKVPTSSHPFGVPVSGFNFATHTASAPFSMFAMAANQQTNNTGFLSKATPRDAYHDVNGNGLSHGDFISMIKKRDSEEECSGNAKFSRK